MKRQRLQGIGTGPQGKGFLARHGGSQMLETTMTVDDLAEHYNQVARRLVEAHLEVKEEPLLLAAQLRSENTKDLILLEVIENFPGAPDEELFVTEMPPSHDVRILGTLKLILGNLKQLEAAQKRGDKLLLPPSKAKSLGLVLFPPQNKRDATLTNLIKSLELEG